MHGCNPHAWHIGSAWYIFVELNCIYDKNILKSSFCTALKLRMFLHFYRVVNKNEKAIICRRELNMACEAWNIYYLALSRKCLLTWSKFKEYFLDLDPEVGNLCRNTCSNILNKGTMLQIEEDTHDNKKLLGSYSLS